MLKKVYNSLLKYMSLTMLSIISMISGFFGTAQAKPVSAPTNAGLGDTLRVPDAQNSNFPENSQSTTGEFEVAGCWIDSNGNKRCSSAALGVRG